MVIHDDVQFQLHLINVTNTYSFKCLKLEWTMMQYACLAAPSQGSFVPLRILLFTAKEKSGINATDGCKLPQNQVSNTKMEEILFLTVHTLHFLNLREARPEKPCLGLVCV